MNRLDRLSSILIQLQSRTRLRAQDIAQRFEIGLRTVYRDIRTLELAGIPIIAEAGKGYSLAEGYKLPPVMFTREEVIALITAEKLLVKLADESSGKSYRLAMDKIRSVLKTSEKEYLENMETNIEVIASRPQRYHPLVIDPPTNHHCGHFCKGSVVTCLSSRVRGYSVRAGYRACGSILFRSFLAPYCLVPLKKRLPRFSLRPYAESSSERRKLQR